MKHAPIDSTNDTARKTYLDYLLSSLASSPLPAYFINLLREIPFGISEIYSGLIPIDMKNSSRALFFVFQPTVAEPVDKVTIWLNGGPGERIG